MSTSPRPAAEPLPDNADANSHAEVLPFSYADAAGMFAANSHEPPFKKPEFEAAAIERRAYEAGRKEGEAVAKMQFETQLQHAQQAIHAALENFTIERKNYYQRIEQAAVQLSLAIAQKILHRAVQADPLVLAGIAHVALQKLDSSTEVTLRVSSGNVPQWQKYFDQHTKSAGAVVFVEDPSLSPHSCVLQTSLGTTAIGIDTQLLEIEKGFADLLAQQPK